MSLEALVILWIIDIGVTCSALLTLTVASYLRGFWHFPYEKLSFLPYKYHVYELEEGNKRYIKIFVGNTYIHSTMELEMTPDGLFDYSGMVIDGVGASYTVAPPRGTNILDVHNAIKNLLENVAKKYNISITIELSCQSKMHALIEKIDNLKYTERVANEQK